MRNFTAYIFISFVLFFAACQKTTVYELDYAYNKRLITSDIRDKFLGDWSRSITIMMPEFVFNPKDSINPGVLKFSDSIFIRPLKDSLSSAVKNDVIYYLDSLKVLIPQIPGSMDLLKTIHVKIADTLSFTYGTSMITVRYNPTDSTVKFVDLEMDGQAKRNPNFNSGLLLESGNLALRKSASLYIGFWNSYLTKYANYSFPVK